MGYFGNCEFAASKMIDWIRKLMGGNQLAVTPPEPVVAAPTPIDLDDERLPKTARELAEAILARIATLLDDSSHSPFEQVMLNELAVMRNEHLTKLLRSYKSIPTEHRKEIFKKSGRSASYLLEESLRKMLLQVEAISRDLAQNDIDAFKNNTEFVSRRYGGVGDPFD